ncbi:hypothetical protein [Coleofasciculus sp. F4-SAH-05]|uniref:hypothetical protein n=1 Tax=Coleofasciculus sp. F4-SAH-05 TaxID=3069525 RepID=UPI00406390A6
MQAGRPYTQIKNDRLPSAIAKRCSLQQIALSLSPDTPDHQESKQFYEKVRSRSGYG